MILYEKKFPLGDGISLSRYIETLEKMTFSPYTLLIREIPGTKDFLIEIVKTNSISLWGRQTSMTGEALLDECTIKHLQDEKFFTLQASTGSGNSLKAFVFLVKSLLLLLMILSTMFIKKDVYGDLFIFVFILLLFSPPSLLTYFHEKALLDRIGSIGSEL